MAGNKADEVEEVDEKKQQQGKGDDLSGEMLIKHPLHNTWTLWYYENDRKKTWEENQREITSFATVEDFWSLYNHIRNASELSTGCDYSLFKKGVRPMWEDDANKHGGRWLLSVDKKTQDLDRYWLEVLLCMVGEAFDEYSDEVCGAVVNVRARGDKIGIWTADANHSSSIMEIGRRLKERLRMPPKLTMSFQSHKDTASKVGANSKSMFTV
ncbi:eukaryotic translation initiation factor 4E-1A-like [Thrips palmi]|uniref:eIF-4F 25 kDa subunit n=1 Tax=Thrips palmi TaxID=161013 RepID=A0A6P8YBL5_THRPL|nr:eukaryotic translation initiation factor 4E-1A-like [Thrips palmi]